MAYELDDLIFNLQEEYLKRRRNFLLTRNISYNHIDSTSIKITAKILNENVDIPVDKDLVCELMESAVNYYKKRYYEIGKKINSIKCNDLEITEEGIFNLGLIRKDRIIFIEELFNDISDDVIIRHLERKGYKVSK